MNHAAITEYLNFRQQIDQTVTRLEKIYHPHLHCAKGCDQCCFSFRVFPVEWFAIAGQLNKHFETINKDQPIGELEKCLFLKNHACTIYPHRPIICRTHGLPLLSMNETGTEWELNICELNFTEADDDSFDDDNLIEQDTLNSELFQINKRFIADNPQLNLSEFDLIPLKALV